MHKEWIRVLCVVGYVFFCMWISNCSTVICEKDHSISTAQPLHFLWTSVMWVHFCDLYSFLLICLSAQIPIHTSLVTESWKQIILVFKFVLVILVSLLFYTSFKISFLISVSFYDFYSITVEFVYILRKIDILILCIFNYKNDIFLPFLCLNCFYMYFLVSNIKLLHIFC